MPIKADIGIREAQSSIGFQIERRAISLLDESIHPFEVASLKYLSNWEQEEYTISMMRILQLEYLTP